MSLRNRAVRLLINATKLKPVEVESLLEVPPDPKLGDLAFPCFSLAKKFKGTPPQIAMALREKIAVPPGFQKIEINGPYLNFFYDSVELAKETLNEATKKTVGKGKRKNISFMLEYSGPNPLKAFHVGHLRNTALGSALFRIMELAGFRVIPVNYYNNTGIHIAKTLWAYNRYFKGKEGSIADKGAWIGNIYTRGALAYNSSDKAKKEIDDLNKNIDSGDVSTRALAKKLQKWSTDYFDRIYAELGARFDHIYYDSEFVDTGKKVVADLERKGLIEYDGTAPIINLEQYGLGKKVLLRSDGSSVYITKDLSMAQQRFRDYNVDGLIYVVGSEQSYHFNALFKILELHGFRKAELLHHLKYELVNTPSGKMSSRAGQVVTYAELSAAAKKKALREVKKRNPTLSAKKQKELADKVAVGAMLYSMLSASENKTITFDIDKAVRFEGDTGPYLQYALVRANKILKKSRKSSKIDYSVFGKPSELALLRKIGQFSEIVQKAAALYQPHVVANYAYTLAQSFSSFYENCPVIQADSKTKAARLLLVAAFANTLRKALYLLGIEEVELM